MTNKKQKLFLILSAIFLTNTLLAELVGVKIFSLESSLGFSPIHLPLFGYYVDFNLTAGAVIWPVVFIVTDIINEYFGKKGVRIISLTAVGCILYMFLIIYVVINLVPATFWTEIHAVDVNGDPFDINFAFNKVYSQGMGIIMGSIVAFLVAQFIDVIIFQRLRKVTGEKMIWLRATGSTLFSQLIDSFVVLFIAFYLFSPTESRWDISQIISVGSLNYIYKFCVAILLTPLIYFGHSMIDLFLGAKLSNELKTSAASSRII